jgi:cell division inhibitor SepF
MDILGRLKGAFGIDEEEFDDDELMEEEEETVAVAENTFKADFTQNVTVAPAPAKKERNVSLSSLPQLQVVLVKPERFDDARPVADHLNSKHTVVLNLEATNKEVSRRLIDFLSGVAYANNGQIKRVANSTYIITPYNVNIMGDLLDELESSGVFF